MGTKLVSKLSFITLFLTLLLSLKEGVAFSYPNSKTSKSQNFNNRSQADESTVLLKQVKVGLSDLKHEMGNHETEMRVFEEKLSNQEASVDYIRQELSNDLQIQKEISQTANIQLTGKIDLMDQSLDRLNTVVKGVISDLQQIKNQSNESVIILSQYKQKFTDLERLLEAQQKHMQNLETALHSMLDLVHVKGLSSDQVIEEKIYKVQPGDSLGKIAVSQKVSIEALRKANPKLSNDRIIIGQKLIIPN